MNIICKIFKSENKVYLSVGILLIVAFIINITLIGICPHPDCIHQVYNENTSNFYIATYYVVLYVLPLWVMFTSLLLLVYLIVKRIITKNKEYNRLIIRFIIYILSGLFVVMTFVLIFIKSYFNGKFDFWMFPKDSGEMLLIVLTIGCLSLRKLLTEWNIDYK